MELKNSPKHHVSGLGYQVDETINWNKDITGDHIKGWKNYTYLIVRYLWVHLGRNLSISAYVDMRLASNRHIYRSEIYQHKQGKYNGGKKPKDNCFYFLFGRHNWRSKIRKLKCWDCIL